MHDCLYIDIYGQSFNQCTPKRVATSHLNRSRQDDIDSSATTPIAKSAKPSSVSGIPTPKTRPGSRRHSSYRGIRSRRGKWVSEIREPGKTTRIWLGTYLTPEMAAAAYDVAVIALKGPDADLNFPNTIHSYPKVASTSAADIQATAATAAASMLPKPYTSGSSKDSKQDEGKAENEGTPSSTCMESGSPQDYIDEEELLNYPNLVLDMAGGMLVSPPRINSPPSDDSPGNLDVESLWTYT